MDIKVKIEDLRKKKIFVATPMYGGMCSGMYTRSCIDLSNMANKYDIDVKFFYIFNESLITRARNYLVDEFLRAEEYTHLLFIDSDIAFNPNDAISLAAICNDDKYPIVAGPYPKKTIAWEKIRNAVDAGLGDENPMILDKFSGDFVFNPVSLSNGKISLNEPVEVLEAGTGFMMIDRSVFLKYKEAYPQFNYKPDHNRTENFKGDRYIHAYFDTVIDSKQYLGDVSDESDRYLSEDYFFCQFVRKIGYKIYLCPWMRLAHTGSYVFNGSMGSLAKLEFASHGMDNETRVKNYEKRRRKNKRKRN